jgi:hypothetical protein
MNDDVAKSTKHQIRTEASHVRDVLNNWNPIPGSPKDEYDCLVDHIVSALHRGVDAPDLSKLIESEFHEHFGLPVEPQDVRSVAVTLSDWWAGRETS